MQNFSVTVSYSIGKDANIDWFYLMNVVMPPPRTTTKTYKGPLTCEEVVQMEKLTLPKFIACPELEGFSDIKSYIRTPEDPCTLGTTSPEFMKLKETARENDPADRIGAPTMSLRDMVYTNEKGEAGLVRNLRYFNPLRIQGYGQAVALYSVDITLSVTEILA